MKPLQEYINESLFGAFKAQWQITKVQGKVFELAERLIKESPEKYRRGADVLRDCESEASKWYKEFVVEPDAMRFGQWWAGFEKSASQALDRMMK